MSCLPVVNVGRPDIVQLSGCTTLKAMKVIYNWTVSGFDICPEDTESISSPVFSHPNSSKWCVELENEEGNPVICFRLVANNDSLPVSATLKAFVLDQAGAKHYVYPAEVHKLEISERSPRKSVMDNIESEELGEDWNFECEVCTVEVVTEDSSIASEEEFQSAVAKDLEHLLDSKDLTDVTLNARGVRLEAHRAILCARSPVFRAMLSHDTKEAREGIVEIPDVEPDVVSEMLRYMYTDRIQLPGDITEQLLVASDKYGLQDAKLKCELNLAKQLTVDSAADIAACAVVYSCSFLQKVCVSFIKQNLQQVMGTRGWANIIEKYPKAVKTISELITEGPERFSTSPVTAGSQSDATSVTSPTAKTMPDYHARVPCAGSLDAVWDSGYTRLERKKVVYVWTIVGLTNWPQGRDFVASPSFCHPETIQWEVRLYKQEKEYHVHFKLLENRAGESVMVDLSVSVIPPEGNKCKIHTSTDNTFEEGSVSEEKIECGYIVDDVLALECEISMVCVIQQSAGAVKPVLQSVLREDLNSLLESGNLVDFKLRAGTAELGAHRAILAARSPFFARILQSGSEQSKVGQLELPDVKPEVLAEILCYMYTGKVKNLDTSTAEILAAAHKFELFHLKRECVTHLSRQLTVGNAVATAVCAIENQSDMLLNISLGFIRLHVKQVMGTNEWIEAIDRHPTALKRISQLVAEPEM